MEGGKRGETNPSIHIKINPQIKVGELVEEERVFELCEEISLIYFIYIYIYPNSKRGYTRNCESLYSLFFLFLSLEAAECKFNLRPITIGKEKESSLSNFMTRINIVYYFLVHFLIFIPWKVAKMRFEHKRFVDDFERDRNSFIIEANLVTRIRAFRSIDRFLPIVCQTP